MNGYNGVINIYKEKGYTSHDVVNIVRRTLNRVKAGHTGTLDPEAEGVLPVCVGKATKIADYLSADIKGYRAELVFGADTDTQDATGTVIRTYKIDYNEQKIQEAVNSFAGEYWQTPPMYSALKVNGQKLYELARQGKEAERAKRLITIHEIKVLKFLPPDKVCFEAICSKGTYIRTLCEDIGAVISQGGHMGALLRFRSGGFYLENAIKLDELKRLAAEGKTEEIIIPIEKALGYMRKFNAKPEADKLLYNGNKLPLELLENAELVKKDEKILIKDFQGNLLGVYLIEENRARPVTMLADTAAGHRVDL